MSWCGRESWLRLMHEVGLLRLPLAFDRASRHPSITVSGDGAVATRSAANDVRPAASKVVMRPGRHFVQFPLLAGDSMFFGVIRPGWDVEGGTEEPDECTCWPSDACIQADGHCFYQMGGPVSMGGVRSPAFIDWGGMQDAEQGHRIGMLLDLDQGSMTLYKDEEMTGVMQAEGLSGPL